MADDFDLQPPPLRKKQYTCDSTGGVRKRCLAPHPPKLADASRLWRARYSVAQKDLDQANAHIRRLEHEANVLKHRLRVLGLDNGELIAKCRELQTERDRLTREWVPRACLRVLGAA